jgi:hypothetical protein
LDGCEEEGCQEDGEEDSEESREEEDGQESCQEEVSHLARCGASSEVEEASRFLHFLFSGEPPELLNQYR